MTQARAQGDALGPGFDSIRVHRAGISTFDLSRYMGASLTMIDRHYGHLAKDGREHAITLLDAHTRDDVHAVDAT
jgi:hypothetical protein